MVINRETFLEKLSASYGTVASTDRVSVFQSFCFRDGFLSSFDGLCGTVYRLDCGLNACIDADHLIRIVKSCDAEEIDLSQTDDGNVWLRTSGAKIKIPYRPSATFAEFVPKSYNPLLSGKSAVSAAVGMCLRLTEETKTPQYSGIGIYGSFVYATDGSRATRCRIAGRCEQLCTIPIPSAKRLSKSGEPEAVFANRNTLVAKFPDHLFVSQFNAVNVPALAIDKQLAPTTGKYVANFPEKFSSVLNRASIFANERTSGVRVQCKSGKLSIETQSQNGAISEQTDSEIPFDFDIHVRPSQMCAALSVTNRVDFENVITGDRRLLRFVGDDFEHLLCLMSPTV